ncbi:MAG: pectate lyase [Cephaloticoccus sp.]|nr:pectate lyase [Cephaloticoccus sp.]MCF7761923.1 pectate lyase [Cephaloticoccus sp.]
MKFRCWLSLVWILPLPVLAEGNVSWSTVLKQEKDWYGTGAARDIAANVMLYQTTSGGWPKNSDMTVPPSEEFLSGAASDHRAPTIDNGATTTQLWLLARVLTATNDATLKPAVRRGIDYLLESQYLNGGWPQFYPLRKGYYTHITYNDNAMVNVLNLLRSVALGQEPFSFVDETRRVAAKTAIARGIECILRTQVKQDGKLTVWCAQHDEVTFAPAWARNFEPPSLSGSESVGIVKFLMGVPDPSPKVVAAIEGAVQWFEAVQIQGIQVDDTPGADGKRDRHSLPDASNHVLWARFYELGTNRPIFVGRDKVIHYDFNEIERERRTGYSYLSDWPASMLARDYPRWRAKHKLP